LLKENKKKVRELKEENKGLKKLVDSYANDLVAQSTQNRVRPQPSFKSNTRSYWLR
jgi:hypothetical protein